MELLDLKNKIFQGNCIEIIKSMPSKSVDLIFADPPYWMRIKEEGKNKLQRPEGNFFYGCDDDWDNSFQSNQNYNDFTKQWLEQCYRVLKDNGSFWVIGGMQCIYTIGAIMQDLGFWFINDIVWQKSNPTPNFMGTRFNNSHETLIWATKSKKSRFTFHYKTAKELNKEGIELDRFEKGERKQMGSIWKMPVCSGLERLKDDNGEKLHTTQKPESLLYRVIALTSNKGDLVFDPFGGTMTTAAMAKKLGRNYCAIEQSEKYIRYGKKRLEGIVEENTDIANAKYDEKPLKVTMQEMIEKGFFNINEEFYLKNIEHDKVLLKENGRLLYQNELYDIHSLAAKLREVKAKRVNGFNYWYVKRQDGLLNIDEIRSAFRQNCALNKIKD